MIERIMSHMNDHHKGELIGLVQKFGAIHNPKEVSLVGVDTKGLNISADGKMVRVDFPKEVQESELKDAIIDIVIMCMKSK